MSKAMKMSMQSHNSFMMRNALVQARFQLSCSLCSQTYGACIQCAGSRQCFAAFHPTCAARAGLRMVGLLPSPACLPSCQVSC